MKTLVLMPTYNEVESLPVALDAVRAAAPEVDILVIDDQSPDGTGKLADEYAAKDEQIHVLHRSVKEGLGPAYLAGFAWAREHGVELTIEMDADGSHRPQDLARLLARVQDSDAPELVIGSRWVPGGATRGWDARRVALSRIGNLYINALLGLKVKDATAGFRVYRMSLIERMNLDAVEARGYGFQVNMTLLAREAGANIVEVPITFVERSLGTSKLSGDIMTEELRLVTRWGAQRRARQLRQLARR